MKKSEVFVFSRSLLFTQCNGINVCHLVVYSNQGDTLDRAEFSFVNKSLGSSNRELLISETSTKINEN